jgi:hypothetical protein
LDFSINPELNEFAGKVKWDIDFIKEIELAIATVFVLLDIACIDENTHQKLVNMCLKDEICTKRCYNHVYLQNLIKSELTEMLKNDKQRVF